MRTRPIQICLSNQLDTGPIQGYDSRLCMFSHYQIHSTSIDKTAGGASSEDGVSAKVSESTNHQSIQHGSCFSFGAKLLGKSRPKTSRCGLIPLFLVLLSTLGIFGILSIMACHQLCVHNQPSKGGISNASIQGNPAASKGDTSIFSALEGDVSLGIKTDSSGVSDGVNLHGFAVSFADVDSEQLNMQVHFDTDSIFFVYDDSTTGHICNDIWKFIPETM
jgi:hypothetical protein